MKRSLKNTLLGLLGFSAAPMLTACYGVEPHVPDQYWNRAFAGQVTDTLGNPIEGIKVYVSKNTYWWDHDHLPYIDESIEPTMTDAEGRFNFNIYTAEGVAYFVAEDVDGTANGLYHPTAELILDFDGTLEMTPAMESTPEENPEEGSNGNI
jgi:putative lipoprotein (rSAM/lipoprotein system)